MCINLTIKQALQVRILTECGYTHENGVNIVMKKYHEIFKVITSHFESLADATAIKIVNSVNEHDDFKVSSIDVLTPTMIQLECNENKTILIRVYPHVIRLEFFQPVDPQNLNGQETIETIIF